MRHNINEIGNGQKKSCDIADGARLISDEARRVVTRRCIKRCDNLHDKKDNHEYDIGINRSLNGKNDNKNYSSNNNENENKNENNEKNYAHDFISKSEAAKIILDAFGTAKTVKKYNSTKYGKFLSLQYRKCETRNLKLNAGVKDLSWDDYFSSKNIIDFKKKKMENQYEIVGGYYSTYLFEIGLLGDKNRGNKNQNFNIFYYLFSGLTENVYEKSGRKIESFRTLPIYFFA